MHTAYSGSKTHCNLVTYHQDTQGSNQVTSTRGCGILLLLDPSFIRKPLLYSSDLFGVRMK